MHDDLDHELDEWGRSKTPPVDGAFANRLEASLRREMLDRSSGPNRGWAGVVFRPGVVVMAIAVLLFGVAFVSRASDDAGVADGTETTVPTTATLPSTTTIVAQTTVTTAAPKQESDPPRTVIVPTPTVEPGSPGPEQTTVPPTTVPPTTVPPTTVPPTTGETTTPAAPIIDLTIERDGRQVTASWVFERETDRIVGWVLIASLDGEENLIADSRDVTTRILTGRVTDLEQTFRVEGRSRDGAAVVTSDEVTVNRGG